MKSLFSASVFYLYSTLYLGASCISSLAPQDNQIASNDKKTQINLKNQK